MTKLNDLPLYRTASDLEPNLANSVLRWGLSLADTKHRLGIRLSEWINGAPALEATVGMAAMTQDELGHARGLFFVLRQFPDAPPELGSENDLDRTVFYNPTLLDSPWKSWLDVIAVNILLDRALSISFEALRESRFSPFQGIVAKVLQEEAYHRIFGESWLARLARDDSTHSTLQEALAHVWPVASGWFGPPDDPDTEALVEAGILAVPAENLRKTWQTYTSRLLEKHGMPVPDVSLDWASWDPARREVAHAD